MSKKTQIRRRTFIGGALAGAICFEIEGGRITRIFSIANPHKLGRLDEEAELMR
jgi:RNA polymerase sigma-70 factor (ECF subfamily)